LQIHRDVVKEKAPRSYAAACDVDEKIEFVKKRYAWQSQDSQRPDPERSSRPRPRSPPDASRLPRGASPLQHPHVAPIADRRHLHPTGSQSVSPHCDDRASRPHSGPPGAAHRRQRRAMQRTRTIDARIRHRRSD
jgi:hypothetical protein